MQFHFVSKVFINVCCQFGSVHGEVTNHMKKIVFENGHYQKDVMFNRDKSFSKLFFLM